MVFKESEEDESLEHTLLIVREVHVYKIPARSTSGGYKCAEWLVSDRIWSGRLRVVSLKDRCEIRLEEVGSSELFACCPVYPGKRDASIESAVDSSRYFVIRIDDGKGRHAFLGLGFNERSEAFDFNVALGDHEKHILREAESAVNSGAGPEAPAAPALDLRLKEGETLHINMKTKLAPAAGPKKLSTTLPAGAAGFASTGRMVAPLAPPPGGSRLRDPLPPPPADSVRAPPHAARGSAPGPNGPGKDALRDLSSLERALPSKSSSGPAGSSRPAGWADF